MAFFAAFLKMADPEKSARFRPDHKAFLEAREKEGKIFARGRFSDDAGGLVVYVADSLDEAMAIAQSDPYIVNGARTLEMHPWEMKVSPMQS
ncbi:MAG: YciI family protein [Vicinamibacterales bacterium]